MAQGSTPSSTAGGRPTGATTPGDRLIPRLWLRRGRLCRWRGNGPEPVRGPGGASIDPFDVIDEVVRQYGRLCLVDLDGIERGQPQLDYLQEFSRDLPLWVDAGVRDADQSIDVIVTGAERAIVSCAMLEGPEELERAWALTTEITFEIPIEARTAQVLSDWETDDPLALARTVRAAGPSEIILSFLGTPPDWALVQQVAALGPTWVGGDFQPTDAARATASGARGGIFAFDPGPLGPPPPTPDASSSDSDEPLRDDEN